MQKIKKIIEEAENRKREECKREINMLREKINSAPIAIIDTRDALGICAPSEDDFPALYALQGKRVRLVLDEI